MVLPTKESDLNPYLPPASEHSEHVERPGAVWSDSNVLKLALFMQFWCLMLSVVLATAREDFVLLQQAYPQVMFLVRNFSLACFAAAALVALFIYRWPLMQRVSLVAVAAAVFAVQLSVTGWIR